MINNKMIIATIMITVILVTAWKHNRTNDIDNNVFLKNLAFQVLLSTVSLDDLWMHLD